MIFASLPPMPIGGSEIQGFRLCKALHESGVETQIITYGKIWHKRKGELSGVKYTRISSPINILTDILSIFKRRKKRLDKSTQIIYNSDRNHQEMTGKVWIGMRLRYLTFYLNAFLYLWFRKNKFDIIHTHTMEWPAFIAVRLGKALNKPVLIKDSTMNGISNILRYPKGKEKQQEISSYAHFVAMTRVIKENYLKSNIPEQKIALIPNGIQVTPAPVKTQPWTGKVVFVGNLTQQPAKGVDTLLLAWKMVLAAYPSATLSIIGSGDIDAYKLFCEEQGILPAVQFYGKQDRVKNFLLTSDIFVLPSRREGMSNALMEAMLCAMPIVATDISGNQDLVDDHISGILVPPSDIERLSKALLYMLQHPEKAKSMGKKAYESVVKKCDINNVAANYTSLYQKILGQS